jgi:hypothetical protein
VSVAGTITIFAGYPNYPGDFGDGGPATSAALYLPVGVAVDATGNVYIASAYRSSIRKVSTSGIISTVFLDAVAGGFPLSPVSVAADGSGNLYFASNSNFIGRVSPNGALSIVVGEPTDSLGFSGDGGMATNAQLCLPSGVTVSAAGNLFFADSCNNRIRKVSGSGIISTIAGNGTAGYSGDGGPAVSAQLSSKTTLATDAAGNLYIADYMNSRVRMINAAGVITTIAGIGSPGFSGDGGPANSAQIYSPASLALDPSGNLYISDVNAVVTTAGIETNIQDVSSRIRKVIPTGTISTIAGSGQAGDTGDGGPATSAQIDAGPIAVDTDGNLYFADNVTGFFAATESSSIRKVSASGIVTTIAGANATLGLTDGVPALSAFVPDVNAITTDAGGDVFFSSARPGNSVRKEAMADLPKAHRSSAPLALRWMLPGMSISPIHTTSASAECRPTGPLRRLPATACSGTPATAVSPSTPKSFQVAWLSAPTEGSTSPMPTLCGFLLLLAATIPLRQQRFSRPSPGAIFLSRFRPVPAARGPLSAFRIGSPLLVPLLFLAQLR